ncbi:MAG TPA: TonB-dependent receptor, partial [Bacteroidia bacterium]|nr:TonB-dependent receptor [Bacteroidia bacterium]
MYRILLLLVFIGKISITDAQTKITGNVKDAKGQYIPGANVFLKDTYDGTSSDNNGNFSFTSSETGEQTVSVSFIGFENTEKKIELNGKPVEINFVLKEKANELNTVTISAGAFEASDEKKMVMLRPLDIVTTAGAAGDIYGAIQTLPGAQTIGETQGLFVRGGDASEAKTIIDGVVVANPYFSSVPDVPQRGRFSPFLFKGTNFSTGGYSAQYGQAMSSALILESQDISQKTTSGISLMSVGGGLSHDHRWKNTSAGIYGNYINLRPYFKIVPQLRDWTSAPQSASGSFIFRQQISKTGLLKFFASYSYNDLALSYANLDDSTGLARTEFSLKNNNFFSNVSYKDIIKNKWTIFSSASYSKNMDNINIGNDKFLSETDVTQGRITVTRSLGELTIVRFGGELQQPLYKTTFNQYINDKDELYAAGYTEADIYITKKLVSRLGGRIEHSKLVDKYNIAPRTSLAYKVSTNKQFSFAYGDFFQLPDERFVAVSNNLAFEKATHYILNFQHLDEKRTFRMEGYYKDYTHLLKIIPDTNTNGSGYAKGFDIFWRDKKTIKYGDYWISYSFLDTKRNYLNYPESIIPTFASKHTLSVVFKYFFPKPSISAGITYVFATGRTYYTPQFAADKTKNYNNLSLTFNKLTSVGGHFTVIVASVGNVLGFENVYTYNYSSDGKRREA